MSTHTRHSYTIGFFTTGTESEYSCLLSNVVGKVAEQYEVNLIIFLGGSLNPPFTEHQYDYQCNTAFHFAHNEHLDGIILASGVLSSFLTPMQYEDFYKQYKAVPMVSLGTLVKDLPSVYTNNQSIVVELVNHLIIKHHKKRIAFLSGPIGNVDAQERFCGYREALTNHHISLDHRYIYFGDFSASSAKFAISEWLDKLHLDIDAIVCANDTMALAIINELHKRQIAVPETIAVTGFDNVHSTTYHVPSLTTVEQPLEAFATSAFELLFKYIIHGHAEHKMIPCHIVYRESCGCTIDAPTTSITLDQYTSPINKATVLTDTFLQYWSNFLPSGYINHIRDFVIHIYLLLYLPPHSRMSNTNLLNLFNGALHEIPSSLHMTLNLKNFVSSLRKDLLSRTLDILLLRTVEDLFQDLIDGLSNNILKQYGDKTSSLSASFVFIRQILLNTANNIHDLEHQPQSIIPPLIDCGINSCLIYLYPKSIPYKPLDDFKLPSHLHLYTGYIDKKPLDNACKYEKISPNALATHYLINRPKHYIVLIHSIFFNNKQLGVIILELPPSHYHFVETLTLELGASLKLSTTFSAQKHIEATLQHLSETDELTSLLNRRGFFEQAKKSYLTAKAKQLSGILFYADMDGLKTINDTFGHTEGDSAILTVSLILKETFYQHDLIARMGGDEFTILCINRPIAFAQYVQKAINERCNAYNMVSNKPYILSISLGILPFDTASSNYTIEQLLTLADKRLYAAKKHRKRTLKTLLK